MTTNVVRPAPAVTGTGRPDEHPLTVRHHADRSETSIPVPDWMSWDTVEVSVNPELAADLAGDHCTWCGYLDHPTVYRVHGPWRIAMDCCSGCAEGAIVSACRDGAQAYVETTR